MSQDVDSMCADDAKIIILFIIIGIFCTRTVYILEERHNQNSDLEQ